MALGACDPSAAQAIIDADCQALAATTGAKADLAGPLAQFACKLGLYAACETPACTDEEGLDRPDESAPCADWQAFRGCATCEYYACRERISQCGESGYLVGFGGRYCHRFATVTEPRVSVAAAAWLERVRACLIGVLETDIPYEASCQTIEKLGLDSHARCYVETGFCELKVSDWFAIINSVDPGDIPLRSFLQTAHGCVAGWL